MHKNSVNSSMSDIDLSFLPAIYDILKWLERVTSYSCGGNHRFCGVSLEFPSNFFYRIYRLARAPLEIW